MRLKQLLSGKKALLYFFLFAAVILAAYFRFHHLPQRTVFDADQEEIAYKAQEILSGDPALLGPKTSVGGFSIGPLFAYLWAAVGIFFSQSPLSGAYLSSLIGIATLFLLYFSAREMFGSKVSLLLSLFYAVSFGCIFWDQNPWAPSLFYPSQLLILWGAYISQKDPKGIVLAALGVGLGFQSHFGIFLSVLSLAVFWAFFRPRLKRGPVVLSLIIIFASLAPWLVFDLTHGFVNSLRLMSVFKQATGSAALGMEKLFSSAAMMGASVIYPYFPKIVNKIIFLSALGLGAFFAVRDREKRRALALILVSIVVPVVLFIPYKSFFSEYYLMMIVPGFLLLLGYFIHILVKGKYMIPVFLVFAVFVFYNLNVFRTYHRPLSLKAKMDAVGFIVSNAPDGGYGVSLTTELGYNFGYGYIFDYFENNLSDFKNRSASKQLF